jgi:glutathione S-transferase
MLDRFIIQERRRLGFFESPNPEVKALRGLHLYHFFLSNCSQRVRMVLEEKGLEWTSHHVNLPANEHATDWYQSINPGGVVPTLVHDGQVVLESNDIIQYLDERFPKPPLTPSEPEERVRMIELIEAASASQLSIKTISHDRLFRPHRQMSDEQLDDFATRHRDAALIAFMRDFCEDGGAWKARVAEAERRMNRALERLEGVLGAGPWLCGGRFGLADISWIVNVHRLIQASYELPNRPRTLDWHQRVTALPSFDRAIASYRPG